MTLGEAGDARSTREWRDRFAWIDPSDVHIDGEELHWNKLNMNDARRSFSVLESMRPYLEDAEFGTREDVLNNRDRLASLKDSNNSPLFSQTDLRFYDLYFGGDHIRVDKMGDQYDVTNGRHRLWLAQQSGVKELPVWMKELVETEATPNTTKETGTMSGLELRDVENESKEQHEQAEEMKGEVEQHKERAEKLEATLREIRAAGQELGSNEIKKAEASAETARAEIEQRLREVKDRRDKMLQENKNLSDKLQKVGDGRRKARHKLSAFDQLNQGASSEFRSQIQNVKDSMDKELEHLSDAREDLDAVRQKLQALDV